ncbi:MAG: hypothetical protein IPN92_01385 [Chromatiaceae bacterium]|nr:hypothetical protein [Chromatiaceae bacterium]
MKMRFLVDAQLPRPWPVGLRHEGARPNLSLNGLRDRYGKATLRKARALALLSVRSGKGLLAQAA